MPVGPPQPVGRPLVRHRSVVARIERNFVINALYLEFGRITAGLETPIWWDDRLFR